MSSNVYKSLRFPVMMKRWISGMNIEAVMEPLRFHP